MKDRGPEDPTDLENLNALDLSTGNIHSSCELDTSADAVEVPRVLEAKVEVQPDIEHIPVHDDPRHWTSFKKVN
jgi:hypothetical protein